jgi:hypothetical protein
MDSSIFTNAEMKAIVQRLQGDHTDPTGIYAGRVRPKLKEIQAWHAPEIRTQIKKLLEQKRKTEPDNTPAKPNEEKSLGEFAQETGY